MESLNELLARYFRDGDAAAMEAIVSRTRGRLLAAARRIGSPQDAEDSVQATYHALLRRGDQTLEGPLIAWLLTVVVRIAYRRKAIDGRQAKIAGRLALPSDEAGPLRRAESTERAELLRAEVAQLPAKYRDVLVLRYFEGLSRAECAALLEVSEETAKTRLRRGRELLRGRLHPRLRHAFWFAPWLLADAARAGPAVGVVMKTKAGFVVALLALLGLVAVGTNALRGDEAGSTPRSDTRSTRREQAATSKTAPDPETSEESRPKLRSTFDLSAVDRVRDVHGIVVREDGRPVAGARLSLVRHPWRRANTLNVDQYHTGVSGPWILSARDGTFVIPWKRGNLGELRIEAKGLARRWIDDVQAGERLRVVMGSGCTVEVRVVGPDDNELAGVELVLRGAAGGNPEPWARRATTGTDGRARFGHVAGNRSYWIEARHPDYGRPEWGRVQAPGEGMTVRELIRMRLLRTVTGRVTDGETGAPISNATVGLNWVQRYRVLTDSDGRYALPAWRSDGVLSIVVSAPAYGVEQAELGAADEVDFNLERGDRVTGRIIDDAGMPVPGVRVAALGSLRRRRTLKSRGYATSGPDGAFSIHGLRHDSLDTVAFFKQGFGRMLREIDPPVRAGGLVEMGDVLLRSGRSIAGRILDAAGDPIARVPVTLTGSNIDRRAGSVRARRRYGAHGEQEMRHTDDLGRFRFPDLAAGSYTLSASRAHTAAQEVRVKLVVTADRTDVEIRFDATRELELLVTDSDGGPVPNAIFSVQHEGGVQSASTGADGRTTLRVKGVVKLLQLNFIRAGLSDLAYELPVKRRDIGKDVTEVRIEVKRAGVVRGRVLLPNGEPAFRPMIQVRQGDRQLRHFLGKHDGTFRAEVPLDGTSELVFVGMGDRDSPSTDMNAPYAGILAGVVAGARDVTLQLTAIDTGRTLTVRVVDPFGKPLAKIRVFAQQMRFIVTGEDGRVTLDDMIAKPTQVHALPDTTHAPGLVPPEGIEVVPDGQEIEIRFLEGVPLRGTVVRPKGTSGPVYVLVFSGEKVVGTANCDEAGLFEVFLRPAAGEGPFRIQAVDPLNRDPKVQRPEVKGVMVGGSEARLELK